MADRWCNLLQLRSRGDIYTLDNVDIGLVKGNRCRADERLVQELSDRHKKKKIINLKWQHCIP